MRNAEPESSPATPAADTARVRVFPPLLFAVTFVLGLVLQWAFPIGRLPPLQARIAGGVLLLVFAALARWSRGTLQRAGTNINPGKPTLALVTDGPFGYSRNPLYVAGLGLFVAGALLFDATWPLVLFLPMVAVLQWGVIAREERYLSKKFGAAYDGYRSRVRRWF
jgi:protein-S-isoprenylcysteine O-methyltransferase Ste14